jgi:pimeloyl-ACP methyl ester carboxylesterase/predicted glycosyltransferase
MRAREPDVSGFVERDGVRTYYEVFGSGAPTLLLMPTWQIVHSRAWKAQVPYLARHFRVVTFDARGSGRSDQPTGPERYGDTEIVADAVAVLDATGTDRAVAVGFSMSGWWAPLLAARHPDRVTGLALVTPMSPLAPFPVLEGFTDPPVEEEGWGRFNANSIRRDYRGFLEFFFSQVYSEPHSSKQREDSVGWGLETTPDVAVDSILAAGGWADAEDVYGRVGCPALVIQGSVDMVLPPAHPETAAKALDARLLTLEGCGHAPHARDPIKVNLVLRDFVRSLAPAPPGTRRWSRGLVRPKRALYLSSPIGLGHALRDVAIADELRRLEPDLEIDWLTQHPVTAVLEARGETVHPAAAHLANESTHFESESAEHDLHCFQAYRRMDEILVANFMVFHDLLEEEHYDLVIGDEAWDVDYFLHENPELKRSEFAWLTDFVGWLPMPDGGDHEAALAADYNAEMIEHVGRFPHLRSRSIFVGDPDDLVPDRLGPGLPTVREWTEANFDFAGYVTGFDPARFADREALRAELGYGADEQVCIATVGGSAVGVHLLRRLIAAYPLARKAIPGLRMIVVAGPRIDPAALPTEEGLEVRTFVDGLYRHLAACDLAVVQGGLTTTMELAATRRPFLYFPLAHHFEQQFHVRHRLERHRAGRCMDYDTSTPEAIAEAMSAEIEGEVDYRPVAADGAARAAALIAELL